MTFRPRCPPTAARVAVGILCLAAAGPLSGCGGDGTPGPAAVEVEDPWVRAMAAPGAGGTTAAYLSLVNRGGTADRLLGAETPVAERAELHESRLEEGIMRMRPVEGLEIPPGGSVSLSPGGLHLMLVGLRGPLAEGDTVALDLRFQVSGTVTVRVPVRSGTGP